MTDLERAVNWYFTDGYKFLAKNPKGSHQATASSSLSRIQMLSNLMLDEKPADVLLMLYQKNQKPKLVKNGTDN